MYRIMNVHPVTLIVVMAAMMVVPMYALWTYVASGASARKGALIGTGLLAWGAVMTWVCLAEAMRSMGPLGGLIVPLCWAGPTVLLIVFRRWFMDQPLSQRWLVAMQVWRVIGGVFLIEMARGTLPGIFAWPAGVGDVITGVLAAGVLIAYRSQAVIARGAIAAVFAVGMTDLLTAFFFGFTSSPGPLQLFHPAVVNQNLMFPVGLIPLFLVPCVIFFHVMSWMQLSKSGTKARSMQAADRMPIADFRLPNGNADPA
jgi:hypothetical protein